MDDSLSEISVCVDGEKLHYSHVQNLDAVIQDVYINKAIADAHTKNQTKLYRARIKVRRFFRHGFGPYPRSI